MTDIAAGKGGFAISGACAQAAVGQGNDVVALYKGGSVAYTGSGNDVISIGSSVITALASPFGAGGNDGNLTRLDGGAGDDTLRLNVQGLKLDLTQIAHQGGMSVDGGSRIESIERIDITGTGNNTLVMHVNDVLDMAGVNNYFTQNRHDMIIDGNKGDTVLLSGGWSKQSYTSNFEWATYRVWLAKTSLAMVLVEQGVGVLTF